VLLVFAVAVGAAVAVVVSHRQEDAGGWAWFTLWAIVSGLFVLTFLGGFVLGILIAPVAVASFMWVDRRVPHGAEALGSLVGLGANLVLLGQVQGWTACYAAGAVSIVGGISAFAAALTHRDRSSGRGRASSEQG
jgi:hypothetical protein